MGSLADLFNPSFLMFLGILVLVIALLVVYFESKMRDQNHKIASMLSLVSTLAEDMNSMKIGLNQIAISTVNGGGNNFTTNSSSINNLGSMQSLHSENNLDLIEVSDDENEEDENEEEDEDENENENEDENEDEDDNEDEDEDDNEDEDENDDEDDKQENENDSIYDNDLSLRDDNVKIIKLNISQEETESEENTFNLDNADDLVDINCDFEQGDDIPQISEKYTEEILSLKYDNIEDNEAKEDKTLEDKITSSNLTNDIADLKTISINLGDEHNADHIDFKKLQLSKLRSITVEKGLTTTLEAQKLKKQDLLKLLGAE